MCFINYVYKEWFSTLRGGIFGGKVMTILFHESLQWFKRCCLKIICKLASSFSKLFLYP